MGFCDTMGVPGVWQNIDAFVTSLGLATGPPCVEQTTGGVHAKTSRHYSHEARDYGAPDPVAIDRLWNDYATPPKVALKSE